MAFDAELDYILHGKVTGTGKPSEIRDGITGRVLRRSSANLPDSERQNT